MKKAKKAGRHRKASRRVEDLPVPEAQAVKGGEAAQLQTNLQLQSNLQKATNDTARQIVRKLS